VSLQDRTRIALANARLRKAVLQGTSYMDGRRSGIAAAQGALWQARRDRARAARERSIARMPELVERFAANARKNGITVHFAGDAAEAREIVLGIAKARGARSAVKMKSMLTQELRIREHLEEHGIACDETDIGEWILQLAKQLPAHTLAPALHLLVEEVKQIFDAHLGPDARTEPEALVERARLALREKFVKADLGITGANFAIAETGGLLLVSNEGNGRLSTCAPPCHIAMVPVEKVVPTLKDAAELVRMLVSSAGDLDGKTRRLTSFLTWIHRPAASTDPDGSREMHYVLVDNGRSAAVGTPMEEALYCIRCAACSNACPVFRRVAGQTYDSIYSGPIGIPVTALVGASEANLHDLSQLSSLCGACSDACPVKIDIPRLIVEVRGRSGPTGAARRWLRLWTRLASRPGLYRRAISIAARWGRRDFVTRLPALARWTADRTLPLPPGETFRERFGKKGRG
jgi:L-lactate dehydrogenase complex protein LldF